MTQSDLAECPECGGDVAAVVTTGPTRHRFAPCGCDARDFEICQSGDTDDYTPEN